MGGHPNFKCHSVSHHDVWEQFIPFFEGSWGKISVFDSQSCKFVFDRQSGGFRRVRRRGGVRRTFASLTL